MSATVISVPHTGTHFLKARFDIREALHTWEPWDKLVEYCERAEKIYVPLRHPRQVRDTWAKRDRLMSEDGALRWYKAWFQLHALDLIYDLDVIPVDLQKDPRVEDWSKVMGGEGKIPDNYRRVEWRQLFELPILSRHYPRQLRQLSARM